MMIFPGRTPVAAPTHHSRELGRRVEQVVRDYQRENSDLTAAEIRTALLHSTETYQDEGAAMRRLRAILTVVAAAVIAGLAVMTDSGARRSGVGGVAGSGDTVWMIVAGAIAAVAIVIGVLRGVNRR